MFCRDLGTLGPQRIIVAHQSWDDRQFAAKELKLGFTGVESPRILRLWSGAREFLFGVCDFFCQLPSVRLGEDFGGLPLAYIVDEHLDLAGVGVRREQIGTEIIGSEDFLTGTRAECRDNKEHYDQADDSWPVHDSKMLERSWCLYE